MIQSADEFARLRMSEEAVEYSRAATEEASIDVWFAVIEQFPELREWVALNKTVPLSVLERLALDPFSAVRATVAGKRKLDRSLQLILARDLDESVRERLAHNSKCETDVLRLLAGDLEPIVSLAAKNKLLERSDVLKP
jgi:hypothetical protein